MHTVIILIGKVLNRPYVAKGLSTILTARERKSEFKSSSSLTLTINNYLVYLLSHCHGSLFKASTKSNGAMRKVGWYCEKDVWYETQPNAPSLFCSSETVVPGISYCHCEQFSSRLLLPNMGKSKIRAICN